MAARLPRLSRAGTARAASGRRRAPGPGRATARRPAACLHSGAEGGAAVSKSIAGGARRIRTSRSASGSARVCARACTMQAAPSRTGCSERGSVRWICTPWQRVPRCLSQVGVNAAGAELDAREVLRREASARRAPSSQGAPHSSKGRVVPRPSERLVPPGGTSRIDQRGVERGHVRGRHHPGRRSRGRASRGASPPSRRPGARSRAPTRPAPPARFSKRAHSPAVSPWRATRGHSPTKDSKPGWTTPPSTAAPPMGFGGRAPRSGARAGRRSCIARAHGGEVRVVAAADVLHVENEGVQAAQVLVPRRERGEVLAVERMFEDAGAGIDPGKGLLEVLRIAAHAVLRTEQRGERHAGSLVQQIGQVTQPGVHAGRVQDRSDPLPAHGFEQLREAQPSPSVGVPRKEAAASVRARIRRSSRSDQCSM